LYVDLDSLGYNPAVIKQDYMIAPVLAFLGPSKVFYTVAELVYISTQTVFLFPASSPAFVVVGFLSDGCSG
jgi:hypothetical protein